MSALLKTDFMLLESPLSRPLWTTGWVNGRPVKGLSWIPRGPSLDPFGFRVLAGSLVVLGSCPYPRLFVGHRSPSLASRAQKVSFFGSPVPLRPLRLPLTGDGRQHGTT